MKALLLRSFGWLVAACLALPSQAAIIRSPGSTVGQDSFNETVYLVDSSSIAAGAIFTGGTIYDDYWRNSLMPAVHATPPGDCWFNTFQQEPGPQFYRTDCDYQFTVGEQMAFSGAVISALEGASYRVTWSILGNNKSWQFSGNSLDFLFPVLTMPADLTPGHYGLTLDFEQWAPEGKSFFVYSAYLDPKICVDLGEPPQQVCGQVGYERQHLLQSASADLFILAAPVPVPPVLGLLVLGLGLLGWQRRRPV